MLLVSDARERLDRLLARHLPQHSRTKLARLVADGNVLVEGRIEKPSFVVEPGMRIYLEPPGETPAHDLTPAEIPLEILYEDDDLLIVNKPRGLASHPAASLKEPSLVNALLARNLALSSAGGDYRPGIVHRLDKETTGAMIVAKNDTAHVALAGAIGRREVDRRYVAVVARRLEQDRFTISAPVARDKRNRLRMAIDPEGKEAVTHVLRLAELSEGDLISARLETGRTHQIRVHLSAIGHPVIGDRLYAPKEFLTAPLQLHSAYLSLTHPKSAITIEVFAPVPRDFLTERVDALSIARWQ